MNLAIHGIGADLGPRWADTFHDDLHPDLRAHVVLANPPFNMSDWGGERRIMDPRWTHGVPPMGNANFAWLQHIASKLGSRGMAGVVLANTDSCRLPVIRGGGDPIGSGAPNLSAYESSTGD
jgi:type I restriction enzyme M protein